ncbi:hypothetical protein PSECIP111951_02461 [Pseudoalteromonas holothuriae]|uniref:Orphan protein n=1 Tax=Pseudoalteromonas holothuriae TaxID=2963714 RepID=A0ABN8UMM0_9GAMM|nr:hypothetical protein [Pseudoalteromonas sp. CIP111951]CAH9061308.1 hypothetical protein PSECIP111951_02461 [Pseudoalteromonas sp. CIP111951]
MSEDKKIRLLYRVEPGCLGPTGKDFVEGFCEFANSKIKPPVYALFSFVPRYDKTLPEREYTVANKNLSMAQVEAYLDRLDKDKDEFEEQIDELISHAIDAYLKRL